MAEKQQSPGTELSTRPQGGPGLLEEFGLRHNIPAGRVSAVLTKTAFPDAKTEEQLIALLVIANTYNLDPFLKEIHAFARDGRVFPMVGRDGWNKALRQQPNYKGKVITESEKRIKLGNSKPCPEWMECTVNFKDDRDPETVRVYFEEWYLGSNPNWNTRPTHMLRGQAIKQTAREAFGIMLYDADDKARIMGGDEDVPSSLRPASTNAAKAREALGATPTPPKASDAPEQAPVAVDEVTGEVVEDEDYEPPVGDAEEDYEVVGSGPVEDAEVEEEEAEPAPRATRQVVAAIKAAKRNNGWSDEGYEMVLAGYGVSDPSELSQSNALEVVRHLIAGEEAETQEGMDV